MRIGRSLFGLLALAFGLTTGRAQVVISEFVAENNTGLMDEEGGRSDGNGLGLHHLAAAADGSDPASWRAGLPSLDGTVAYPELALDIAPGLTSGLRVQWPSRAGFIYEVEAAPDLGSTWSTVQVIRAVGSTSTIDHLDVAPREFFRGQQHDR